MRAHLLFHDVGAQTESLIHVHSMSRWTRIIRTTTYALRFIENLRRKRKGEPIWTTKATEKQAALQKAQLRSTSCPLQQEEFLKAEAVLWKQAQYATFPDEVCTLKKNQTKKADEDSVSIEKSSPLYKLTPVMDDVGVIRVGGRLEKAPFLPFDTKFPIILPMNDDVTKRLVQHYHEQYGHANRETVFNELRQRFYIPKLRSVILKVMKSCVWCRVYRCSPRTPKEAPLPVPRVTAHMRPFSSVGVDYLGPIEVTVGRRKEKRYVALFTCLAMRAVHVEVVQSLTAQACLMAIRRFCCRRGVPEEFVSDNATNFKSASKELAKTINEDCADQVTSSRTKWTFIPPGTPHMGGAWERMVRSIKEALTVFDDGRKLTDEILSTSLAEAEDMINSRQLTYVPQESAEMEAISPNHFLRGAVRAEDLEVDKVTDFAEAIRDVYKRSQYLADLMWTRWLKEYLPSINRRTKWFEDKGMIRVDDLVFVVDGRVRKSWTRGIVEEVFPGADGRIRQVSVRTSGGVFKRATANLAILEIRDGKSGTAGGSAPELRPGECAGTTG